MRLVWVKYSKCKNVEVFRAQNLDLDVGDRCVLETSRGVELGKVLASPFEGEDGEYPIVLRKARKEDLDAHAKNVEDEGEAFNIAKAKIAEHGLPMKLVEVEYMLDRKKLFFYFISETRVDFRALVRDLAAIFRTRIEMRQIGVRDEVKILGGLGPCGWVTCCSTFLRKFESISIKMAKEQNLVLNPAKISGLCGRLMCCLLYEYPIYRELWEKLLPLGTKVITSDDCEGEVIGINLAKGTLMVELEDGRIRDFPPGDLRVKDKSKEASKG